jgi:hypothetical protein
MSKFLDLIKKSYLVLEAENPFDAPAAPGQGGDPSVPDAATQAPAGNTPPSPEASDETQDKADDVEAQLKKNLQDLKEVSVKLIGFIDQVLSAKGEIVEREFPDLKKLVDALKEKNSEDPLKYVEAIKNELNINDSAKVFTPTPQQF